MVKRSTKTSATKKTTKKPAPGGRSAGTPKRPSRSAQASASMLDRVACLAHNLWWSWDPEARQLLESIDPALFAAMGNNPIRTIRHLHATRREVLEADPVFAERFTSIWARLEAYLGSSGWFPGSVKGKKDSSMHVAYFCMEYGIHECLPLYSGGLGILAGDHLKSASDLGVPTTGVGMLWKKGYYRQELTASGDIRMLHPQYDFSELPLTDTGKSVKVPMGRAMITAKIWRADVGRVILYLLDTDVPENKAKDRVLTHSLYQGETDDRIRQEIILGVGGLLALQEMGVEPTVYHLNEGHAAFCALERLGQLIDAGHDYTAALKAVRKSTVFTTHTPVPAGNTRYPIDLFNRYMKGYGTKLGLSNMELLALGREDEADRNETFCMTVLALKTAALANGVAELHGATAREMWMKTYDAASPEDVPIGFVTNGVHPQTWIADVAQPFYNQHLKPKWGEITPTANPWKRADKVSDEDLWALRHRLRQDFISKLRGHLRNQLVYHGEAQEHVNDLYDTLRDDALTIGFARRFATYKRAPLIFKDQKRIAKIMSDAERPVQLVFAGKAHPQDEEGNAFARKILEMTRKGPFRGRVWFVENYDQSIGRLLTSGVDLWLNNPIRPMEASGTSGMKPPLNAGLNASILDGWWPEGYVSDAAGKNGWALGQMEPQPTRAKQDAFDAEAIYSALEDEIVPLFYDRDEHDVPRGWVKLMRNSMTSVFPKFSAHRQVGDYVKKYYLPTHRAVV